MSLHMKTQLLELLYRKSLRVSSAVKSAMGVGPIVNLQVCVLCVHVGDVRVRFACPAPSSAMGVGPIVNMQVQNTVIFIDTFVVSCTCLLLLFAPPENCKRFENSHIHACTSRSLTMAPSCGCSLATCI